MPNLSLVGCLEPSKKFVVVVGGGGWWWWWLRLILVLSLSLKLNNKIPNTDEPTKIYSRQVLRW